MAILYLCLSESEVCNVWATIASLNRYADWWNLSKQISLVRQSCTNKHQLVVVRPSKCNNWKCHRISVYTILWNQSTNDVLPVSVFTTGTDFSFNPGRLSNVEMLSIFRCRANRELTREACVSHTTRRRDIASASCCGFSVKTGSGCKSDAWLLETSFMMTFPSPHFQRHCPPWGLFYLTSHILCLFFIGLFF